MLIIARRREKSLRHEVFLGCSQFPHACILPDLHLLNMTLNAVDLSLFLLLLFIECSVPCLALPALLGSLCTQTLEE